jgi:hypothetical protein
MMTRMLTAASVTALLMGSALAQTASPPPAQPGKPPMAQPATPPAAATTATTAPQTFLNQQAAGEWRTTNLVGEGVTGADKKSIGNINDILVDSNGAVKAVVVGVGGFLGIGEKNVAIPFSALNIQREANDPDDIEQITVSYTRQQLEQAPAFKFAGESGNTMPKRESTGASSTAPAAPAAKR